MDDFKIILYILAAVAYFLVTQWWKAFNTPDKEEGREPQNKKRVDSDFPSKPMTSFEDILRELQPKAEKAKEVIIEKKEQMVDNIPPLAPIEISEKKYKTYEDFKPKVLSWEKKAEALEAAKNSLARRKPAFAAYDQIHNIKPQNKYAKLLKSPTTVQDAVILSEILNRKYS